MPASAEPIAIVGAACRLPGGIDSLSGLWDALANGRDLVSDGPPAGRFDPSWITDRNPRRPGKSYVFAGGYLDDLAGFDAGFFGISPREASRMDPQQRLVLELAVEALDDAGVALDRVAGSTTGVFVGVSSHAYGALQLTLPDSIGPYTMTGLAGGNIANRVSHFLDIHGPSFVVDTACSSALVAFDQACQSLRVGSSEVALVGGVNVMLNPYEFVGFAKGTMLSPTGRCRAFSAAADGYVRAEGGGLLVLKPLERARADGDRIHAVVLGTGTNSDGYTTGLALPNPVAQEALLRQVYETAGVDPRELTYFEAHGTGTAAGDPLECQAIGRACGTGRTEPLPIGSVKTNVGHLESGAGAAGLLKAIAVLKHRQVPASLHALPLNPDIDFTGLGLEPATESRPLPAGRRGVVGINSFGFGGTNAHVILAEAPPATPVPPVTAEPALAGPLPVLVSARSTAALSRAALDLADQLEHADSAGFPDLCFTTAQRRTRHDHRFAVLAGTPAEAGRLLRERAESGTAVQAVRTGRVGFVFAGNGSQWTGMGVRLLAESAVFRASVADTDARLWPYLGWSVLEWLADPDSAGVERTEVAQPVLYAVQVGLVAVLAEYGISPDAVLGHSVGEIAAAYTAGALDAEAAARVVAERSRAQAVTAGTGRMAAVGLSETEARAEIARAVETMAGYGSVPEVAAVNSDRDVTLVGDPIVLATLGQVLAERGVFFRALDLDYPFHSKAMDPIKPGLRQALAGLEPAETTIPFISTVTGSVLTGKELDAGYWWRNVREPVHFADATRALLADGIDILIEIGPHPVLATYLRRLAGDHPEPVVVLSTLNRETAGHQRVREAAGHAVAAGADTSRFFPTAGRVRDLPTYPWEREQHWNGSPRTWTGTDPATDTHPLLGPRQPTRQPIWLAKVEPARAPWLTDHRVGDTAVLPGTAYVELALTAGGRHLDTPVELRTLTIPRALVLPWDEDTMDVRLQISLSDEDGVAKIDSRSGEDGGWQTHARGRIRRLLAEHPDRLDLDAVRARLGDTVMDPAEYYLAVARIGVNYGPTFKVLTELRLSQDEVLAGYTLGLDPGEYLAHPALLDGALQAGGALVVARGEQDPFLPAEIGGVRIWKRPPASGLFHVRERSATALEVVWDITVTDQHGEVFAELTGCVLRRFAGRADQLHQHETVLRAAPRDTEPAPSPLPEPAALVAAASTEIQRVTDWWRTCRYDLFRPRLLSWMGGAVIEVLEQLLGVPGKLDSFTLDDLLTAGVLPKQLRYVRLLASVATDQGLLVESAPDRWRRGPAASTDRWSDLFGDFPQYAVLLVLYGRCAAQLPAVLTGRQSPFELLFSDSDPLLAEQFYDGTPELRQSSLLAAAAVRTVVESWPVDRPLRILEVGAGTGSATASLLPLLPPERTQYLYTDVSRAFFPRAQARFGAYDFVDYRELDLEQPAAEQGFAPQSFDLVVASNVLHTTANLEQVLGQVAELLAPGGQLLAVEASDPQIAGFCFGALDGLWEFTDDRQGSPLLPGAQWLRRLERYGFTGAVEITDSGGQHCPDYPVLLAQRPPVPVSAPESPRAVEPAEWVIAAEGAATGAAVALAQALAATGTAAGVTTRLTGFHDQPDSWSGLLAPASGRSTNGLTLVLDPAQGRDGEAAGTARRAVHLVLVLEADPVDADPVAATERAVRRLGVLRAVATAAQAGTDGSQLNLWLVAGDCGVAPAPLGDDQPGHGAVWAASRTLTNEHPELTVRRIALAGPGTIDRTARRVATELLDAGVEDEVVLTGAGRFVPRLLPRDPRVAPALRPVSGYRLRVSDVGLAYRLDWVEQPVPVPAAGQVLVEVRATALNYRDVMQAVGLVPIDPAGGSGLGIECAGVVTAVGAGVTSHQVGDRVMTSAPNTLGTHVVVAAGMAGRIPDDMTFTAAATLPVAFLTVQHGLEQIARLAPGETVLVHGAAGGVGLAALQYVQRVGARVIATAGTPAKRDLLHALGVEHVLDSRSLNFADQITELTDGRGVDVVLNSLAGEAIDRGLEVLRPGGRFVELGKRDLLADHRLRMRPFLNNVTFAGIDIAQLTVTHPELTASELTQVTERVAAGEYRPLPHYVLPAVRVEEAFRLLQHSRHVGKIVVDLSQPPPVQPSPGLFRADPAGTYLVVGGVSGLGAVTARWLIDRGARQLALVSRRGIATPGAAEVVRELERAGATVTAYAADASDLDAMREVLASIDATGHRLRGVVHSAMVLDDGALTELTDDQLRNVLNPKSGAVTVLDRLTRGLGLDLFLVHSSMTATVGHVLQANYTAGNMYAEVVVRARRGAGEPGTAFSWGPFSEVGVVSRDSRLAELSDSIGAGTLTPTDLRVTLDELVTQGTQVTMVTRFDWDRLRGFLPTLDTPRFAAVLPPQDEGAGSQLDSLQETLTSATVEQATSVLTGVILQLIAQVVQTDAVSLDPSRRLDQLGIDSLMAAELVATVRRRLECEISVVEIATAASVTDLAARLTPRMLGQRS